MFLLLRAEKCKVMDSKMRPLWLNFENLDPLGKPILQIFKNGDGTMLHVKLHTDCQCTCIMTVCICDLICKKGPLLSQHL